MQLSNYYICKLNQTNTFLNQALILLEKLIDDFDTDEKGTEILKKLRQLKGKEIVH